MVSRKYTIHTFFFLLAFFLQLLLLLLMQFYNSIRHIFIVQLNASNFFLSQCLFYCCNSYASFFLLLCIFQHSLSALSLAAKIQFNNDFCRWRLLGIENRFYAVLQLYVCVYYIPNVMSTVVAISPFVHRLHDLMKKSCLSRSLFCTTAKSKNYVYIQQKT